MLGMSVKDYGIGGVSLVSLGGSVVNFVSNRRLKKRLNNAEQVLQQLGAMPAPTTAPQAQQPQAPQQ